MNIDEAIRKGFGRQVQTIREWLEAGSTNYHAMDSLLRKGGMSKYEAIQVVNLLINEVEDREED